MSAEQALQTAVAVRDKVVQAYQECRFDLKE
ncbi:flagellar hook-basal body complex protein FliE [Bradyrhizobium japonicum]